MPELFTACIEGYVRQVIDPWFTLWFADFSSIESSLLIDYAVCGRGHLQEKRESSKVISSNDLMWSACIISTRKWYQSIRIKILWIQALTCIVTEEYST